MENVNKEQARVDIAHTKYPLYPYDMTYIVPKQWLAHIRGELMELDSAYLENCTWEASEIFKHLLQHLKGE